MNNTDNQIQSITIFNTCNHISTWIIWVSLMRPQVIPGGAMAIRCRAAEIRNVAKDADNANAPRGAGEAQGAPDPQLIQNLGSSRPV